jgi:hypothetical protein
MRFRASRLASEAMFQYVDSNGHISSEGMRRVHGYPGSASFIHIPSFPDNINTEFDYLNAIKGLIGIIA